MFVELIDRLIAILESIFGIDAETGEDTEPASQDEITEEIEEIETLLTDLIPEVEVDESEMPESETSSEEAEMAMMM